MAEFFVQTFLSLALGGLIGLERQRVSRRLVGVRTFAATSFFGFLTTLSNEWMVAIGFLAASAFAVLLYFTTRQIGRGITTEIMIPFSFLLGVLVGKGLFLEAGVAAIAVTFLLAEKRRLHEIVSTVSREELIDLLLFAVITFIVFPFLPEKPLTYFGFGLSPRFAWAVVVVASAISFLTHILAKYFRPHAAEASALLGGAVSSLAALTVFSEKVKERRAVASFLALSSAGALSADLLLLAAVSPDLFGKTALPLLFMLGGFLLAYRTVGRIDTVHLVPDRHPLSLWFIGKFALVFVLVSIIMNALAQNQASVIAASTVAGTVSSTSAIASAAYLFVQGTLDSGGTAWALFGAILASLLTKVALLVVKKQAGKEALLVLAYAALAGALGWWVGHA